MSENTEHVVDRTGWESGPWDTEPDREEWRAHGLPCLIVRNPEGALCGYVGLPPGHRFHGKHYREVDPGVDCHGGLTYASACAGHICHVPQEGEPADVWWLGFDCAHAGDSAPGRLYHPLMSIFGMDDLGGTGAYGYRDMPYVRRQVNSLAEQLAGVELAEEAGEL